MSEVKATTDETKIVPSTPSVAGAVQAPRAKRTVDFLGKDKERSGGGRPRGGGRRGASRQASDMDSRVLAIRRVTRVVAGGRRFSFSVLTVIGDRNGRVGVGLGKGGDTSLAMEKATKDARKNLIKIPLTKTKSISRDIKAKYSSAVVYIQPSPGNGLVAGSALRAVLDLGGVTDVNAKVISRSKNKLNIARASIEALRKLT